MVRGRREREHGPEVGEGNETLPGARRAINNQINEKYFLPHARGGGEGHLRSSALTYNARSLFCVQDARGGRKRGVAPRTTVSQGWVYLQKALRGVISSGNCEVPRHRRNLEIIRDFLLFLSPSYPLCLHFIQVRAFRRTVRRTVDGRIRAVRGCIQ